MPNLSISNSSIPNYMYFSLQEYINSRVILCNCLLLPILIYRLYLRIIFLPALWFGLILIIVESNCGYVIYKPIRFIILICSMKSRTCIWIIRESYGWLTEKIHLETHIIFTGIKGLITRLNYLLKQLQITVKYHSPSRISMVDQAGSSLHFDLVAPFLS